MESTLTPDPYRHERQLIKYGSIAIVILGSLGFPCLARDSYAWFPTYILWAGWLVGMPAWAIVKRFGPTATPLERAGFSGTLALVGLALFQFLALELGSRLLVLGYPLVVMLAMRLAKNRGTQSPCVDVEPMPRGAILGGLVAFAMALGVLTVSATFFRAYAPRLDEHNKTRCLKLLPDMVLHLQAQEEMSHTWPPQYPAAAGVQFRYHLATDAVTMALTPLGVPRLAVNCRYMPALWHLVLALNALLLARRYLGATWVAGLFPILAVFGEDAGWLVPKLELVLRPV